MKTSNPGYPFPPNKTFGKTIRIEAVRRAENDDHICIRIGVGYQDYGDWKMVLSSSHLKELIHSLEDMRDHIIEDIGQPENGFRPGWRIKK